MILAVLNKKKLVTHEVLGVSGGNLVEIMEKRRGARRKRWNWTDQGKNKNACGVGVGRGE